MKRWTEGVIDNVYENILKIKALQPNNTIYYEWLEDDSTNVHPKDDLPAQDVKAYKEDTSPTQYCSSGADISANSPHSNRSLDDLQGP